MEYYIDNKQVSIEKLQHFLNYALCFIELVNIVENKMYFIII